MSAIERRCRLPSQMSPIREQGGDLRSPVQGLGRDHADNRSPLPATYRVHLPNRAGLTHEACKLVGLARKHLTPRGKLLSPRGPLGRHGDSIVERVAGVDDFEVAEAIAIVRSP